MNIFNIFKIIEEQNINLFKIGKNKIGDAEIEFLKKIDGRKIDKEIPHKWNEYVGSIDKCINNLIKKGYLRTSSIEEDIKLLKIVELKDILISNEIVLKGKNDNVIQKILENIDEEKLKEILGDKTRYIVTDKGHKLINEYELKKEVRI